MILARVDAKLIDAAAERRQAIFRQLESRIQAMPDVESAAAVWMSPFSGRSMNRSVHPDNEGPNAEGKLAWFDRVGPGYFQTMRTPLMAGRDFGTQDDARATNVAIINTKFAQDLFGDSDPIGRVFRTEGIAGEPDPTYQIVGVAGNAKYNGLREEQRAIAYLPLAQGDEEATGAGFVIRARGPFSAIMSGIKSHMAQIDGGLLVEFRAMNEQVSRSVMRERLMATLSGGFGVLAALLSALGLYGVMPYMVARRRNEIGVRMALGAQRSDVRRIVFGEAGRLVLIGLGIGLASSFALSRYAESLLYGLQPNDLKTLALGCGLLAATAFLATSIPVRRATKLDPATVLRDE